MSPTLPHVNRSARRPVWLTESSNDGFISSEHRSNYITHPLASLTVVSNLPNIHTSSGWPFTSNSEHRDKYMNHGAFLTRHKTRKGELTIPAVPLQKNTMYRSEYQPVQQEKTKSCKPERGGIVFGDSSQEIGASNSLYRQDFLKWKVSSNQLLQDYKPLTPPRISEPMVVVEAGSERPINKEATLSGETETRNNYKYWSQTREYYPLPKWKQPKVPFHRETSYMNEYMAHSAPPIKACKPTKSSLAVEEGTFDGNSTYKVDFNRKQVPPPPQNVYVNASSLMHSCGPTDWLQTGAPSQPIVEFTGQIFYHT